MKTRPAWPLALLAATLLLATQSARAGDELIRWQRLADRSPWGERAMPRGGLLDGQVYVIGGRAGAVTLYGDTWRSPDGLKWERMSDDTGWGKRAYPEVEVIQGQLVLTGGQGFWTFYNDVWRSADQGRSWQQVNASAPWGPRAGHYTMVVGNDILLFAGGRNSWNRQFYPELWVSQDLGTTWELRATLPADMARAGMQVVELDGALYFMGGDHDRPVFFPNWAGRRNDVWKSTDLGRSWTKLGNAPWSPRTGQQCAAFRGEILCLGGHGQGPDDEQIILHDVWAWNPADDVGQWRRISNTAWGCAPEAVSCGKSDFLLVIRDDKLWTYAGDEEVKAPWPQDSEVWVGVVE